MNKNPRVSCRCPRAQRPCPTAQVTRIRHGLCRQVGHGVFDSTGVRSKRASITFTGITVSGMRTVIFPRTCTTTINALSCPRTKKLKRHMAQDLLEADALKWVKAHKTAPFFLYYALTLPHGKYEIDNVGIYKDRAWTPQQKTYAAMVTRLDRAVGDLLDLLKARASIKTRSYFLPATTDQRSHQIRRSANSLTNR